LAGLYVQIGEFDNSIDAIEKALAVNPGDPELDELMGSVRLRRYNHEIEELKKASHADEAVAKETERNQYAFDNLNERVKRYPNDLRLRYELGVMLYNNSYLNEAIQQFQLSQKSPKHRILSLYHLALCFRDKDQNDLASEQLEKADMEHPVMDKMKKDILYELGEVSARMGLGEKAAGYYKKVYQVDIGYKDVAGKVEEAYGDGGGQL
jgi:tetratricopeptide (TPR) repeat protein